MKILIIEPGKRPRPGDVPNELEKIQRMVGGYIETARCFPDGAVLLCNEEGKIAGLPFNRPLRDDRGKIYDCVVGTCIVIGTAGEEFTGLTEAQVARYTKMFWGFW